MQKRDYLKQAECWLKNRNAGIGIKESFEKEMRASDVLKETSLSHVDWLILPGEKEDWMSEEEAKEWNAILTAAFAFLPEYRKKEEELWDGLSRLYETLLQKREKHHREARLFGRCIPDEGNVIGRNKEVACVAKALKKEKTAFLYGIGGIGKSAVAKAYARTYAGRYDTVVYASCNRGLRELFADDSLIYVQNMSYAPQGKRAELGWYARRKLKMLARITDERTLLVIDNLNNLCDPLLKEALKLPCHLLITTRMNPACVKRSGILVGAMEEKDLLRLFAFYYGKEMSDEEKRDALCILGKFHGHTLYGKLLARECAGKDIRLFVKEKELFEIREQIFGFINFSKKEKEILKNAALLPATGMDAQRFFCLSRCEDKSLASKLKDRGLLEYDAGRGFVFLHPVVRCEVLKTLSPTWSGCSVFLSGFVQEVSDFWNMPVQKKMEYQAYLPAVFDALPQIEESCMDMIFTLASLLWQLGLWSFALRHTKILYQKCRSVFGFSHSNTAHAAYLAASVYHNQGERNSAALWYARAWAAYRDLEEKKPEEEALYRMKYSRYLTLHGKFTEAGETLLHVEDIYLSEIAAGKNVRRMFCWLQNTYIEHTRVCMEDEKNEEALIWCKKAKEIAEALQEGGATEVYILYDEAVLWERMGDWPRAGECLKRAKEMAEEYFDENYPERLKVEAAWSAWKGKSDGEEKKKK